MSKFPQAPFAFVDPKIFVASDLNCEFTVAWSSSGYVVSSDFSTSGCKPCKVTNVIIGSRKNRYRSKVPYNFAIYLATTILKYFCFAVPINAHLSCFLLRWYTGYPIPVDILTGATLQFAVAGLDVLVADMVLYEHRNILVSLFMIISLAGLSFVHVKIEIRPISVEPRHIPQML
ncbi:hypothetical protein HCEG_06195 [Histoplasma capsulatum var. duboisii H88]|uniref:Uncharacterized protein n=1 Tax=Ajellomyces capsulatus (strain H88) TaxID=544711 RepID=F0UPM7_AJEC8|nr:hypothetical protein HCEG_06195 [Histoplasma capsulatum var. duboisii H88]